MRVPLLLAVVMTFALVGCGKKKPSEEPNQPSPPPGGGNSNPGGIVPAGGVGVVINPSAALGGGGGGGAAGAVRKAARRTQALNEMNTLGQVIQLMLTDNGRMPTKEQILAELKQYPKVLEAINEGAFILTGSNQPGGLWAYEVDADTKPGIALIGGRATRSTPDELKPYLDQLPKQPPPGKPNASGQLDPRQPAQPMQPAQPAVNVTKQDMEDVRIFIDNFSGASGKMPPIQVTYDALVQAKSPAAALVYNRAITLTGAATRESVWAYETAALQRGGLICGPNGVDMVTAADLKQRLGVR